MISRLIRNTGLWLSLFVWIVFITVHFFILKRAFDLPFIVSFTDSLVFNSLYLILGTGIWYMTRFSDLQEKKLSELLFYHLTSATVTLLIGVGLGYFILQRLFINFENYSQFLHNSLTIRILIGVVYYVLLVMVFYLIINLRELKEQIEMQAGLKTLVKDAELKMLRSQIQPHFLFNSLNSISSLTLSNSAKAQEMVIKLSEFMRYSLSFKDEKLIPLEKEIYHIQLYLDIEKVRFGDRMMVELIIPEKSLTQKLPAIILQPLVENAVKYGVYESLSANRIKVEVISETNMLMVIIGNDFDPDSLNKKGTGTGLINISKRLLAIYSRSDLLEIDKKDNYFEVKLKIPQDEQI